ncbi:MAG TPA: chemotaxis protein CheW [Ktedonobacterales bacterium]|jgi:purine-binding chemotaxis protein CheW|nr:chemotaxis protein CheW [Ktedonobacterales bacterium]
MSDPENQRPVPQPPSNSRRAQMGELLRQALQTLNTNGPSKGGNITPEALAELAQRAGIGSTSQIADLSRAMGVYAGDAAPQMPQHILFLVGDVECALPSEAVQGVERISEITPVPNTVPWVLGVVQVWGSIVSVVDLRYFFGLAPQPLTQRSRLLVVTRGEMTIGYVVDAVTEMRPLDNIPANSSVSGLPDSARQFASAALQVGGRSVILLDPDRLLFSDSMHHYRAGV